MTNKSTALIYCLGTILLCVSTLTAQYTTNEKIEAEALESHSISKTSWLTVNHGEGWVPHPDSVVDDISVYTGEWYTSEFVYARCGNRHWLCDDRTIDRCVDQCADEYLEVDVDIPEDGDYIIYAYVAIWADSAVIEDNRGCDHGSKWECTNWYVWWDELSALEKIGDPANVSADYIWTTYPFNSFCGQFGLDTVSLEYDRMDCEPYGNPVDPVDCDFPAYRFYLTTGTHTLYLKVGAEFTLIDWICVVKDGDPAPTAEPGASWRDEPQDTTQTDIEPESHTTPEEFTLSQNYPNPFNALTRIEYSLPWKAAVRLTIHDIIGQEVAELVTAEQPAGRYAVTFNAQELSSGIYLYSLEAICSSCMDGQTHFSAKNKMVFLK